MMRDGTDVLAAGALRAARQRKEPRRLSLCPYEEWTKGVSKCAEGIIKATGEIRVLNPRETSRMSGHIEPARAVRAPGAWFPQTEAAECPVSA